ncbi:hypothetical protein PanWU01x14_111580 [Parasponia andersonii]|uniref:Uncharacterized protein n=1 Tax=Parasponia andersonii TaxID=3476 RepID=A0A2P5CZ30_PARAD|nr:hypothetical protein PanWU01x14_111580 [Parasponia andersonii]
MALSSQNAISSACVRVKKHDSKRHSSRSPSASHGRSHSRGKSYSHSHSWSQRYSQSRSRRLYIFLVKLRIFLEVFLYSDVRIVMYKFFEIYIFRKRKKKEK